MKGEKEIKNLLKTKHPKGALAAEKAVIGKKKGGKKKKKVEPTVKDYMKGM
jgi:hypothetical protein